MKSKILIFLLITAWSLLARAGTVTGNLLTPSGLPVKSGTLTFKLNQVGLMSGTGLLANTTAQCFTSIGGQVVGTPDPSTLPNGTVSFAGGTLPGGIYYVQFSFYTSSGSETLPSAEKQFQLTSTGTLIISPPTTFPSTAAGMKVYIGTVSGGETLQGSTGSGTNNYIQSVPLVTGGASPQTINGTTCTIAFNDTIIPYQGYNVSLTSASGNAYPGWPQAWQLNGGTAGTINVSQGAPLWNGTVVYPMPILSQPLNHGPQSISGNLDFGGYNATNIGNMTVTGSFNSQYQPPTIASAITAAGASGSVTIPGSYVGTDTWNSNPMGVIINDQRPNSGTSLTTTNTVRVVNAADYGAICNGSNDDTNAINNAIASQFVYNLPLATKENITVQLPQGSCLVTHPIELGTYGSLVGQDSATFVVCDYAAWQGSDYNCMEMLANGTIGAGASIGQRRIGGFSLIGISNAAIANSQGIYIANNANVYDPSAHAFTNISIDHMQIADFDTLINAQDFSNSQISFVNGGGSRVGFNFNGDVVNVQINNSNIFDGAWHSTSNQTTTYGVIIQSNNKYGAGCATNAIYCAPQGVSLYHTNILSYDTDAYIEQCVSCTLQNGAFDQAAGGPAQSGYSILLGPQASGGGLVISQNSIGTLNPAGQLIYSQLNTTGANNGIWITQNFFFLDDAKDPAVGAVGIDLVGTGTLSEASLDDNKFSDLYLGINVAQNLTYSSIHGNTGEGITSALINLGGAVSLVHTGTLVEANTVQGGVNAIAEGSATGMRVGWNQANNAGGTIVQFLGTQTVSAAGCTITAGAVGNQCGTAVTIPWPNAFPDSNYTFTCGVQSPSQPTGIGVAGIVDGGHISVNEVALNASSVGGGQINCTGTHN